MIRNSVSAENFKVLDDGQVSSLNGYWQGAAKILYVNPNGTTNNTLIGEGGGNAIMTGGGNTSLGSTSFITNTSGTNNVAIGYQSLYSNSVGADNVAIGMNSLLSNTSSYNIGIGVSSLQSNTTGTSNTSIGTLSLLSNISGNYNNAFGIESNRSNLIGSHNSSFGDYSLYSNLADNNTAMGSYALELNTTGANNIALGYQAGFYNTIQSNRLYIHNGQGVIDSASSLTHSMIYGTFDADSSSQALVINASTTINGTLINPTGIIADNDSTPDVKRYNILTYNGTANSVILDDLNNPSVGAFYTIIGNSDTYTVTIVSGGNFKIDGGVSIVLGANDIAMFYCVGDNNYQEVSRSFNQ